MGDRGIPATWAKMRDNNKYCVDRSTKVNGSYSRHQQTCQVAYPVSLYNDRNAVFVCLSFCVCRRWAVNLMLYVSWPDFFCVRAELCDV